MWKKKIKIKLLGKYAVLGAKRVGQQTPAQFPLMPLF